MVETEYCTLNNHQIRLYKVPDQCNNIKRYPSVTSICGIETDMSQWHKKEKHWQEIVLYANTVGTFGHYKIQCDLAQEWGVMNPPLEFSPDQQKAFNQWMNHFPFKRTESTIQDATEKIMLLYEEWKHHYNPQHPYYIIHNQSRLANVYPFEIKIKSHRFGYAGSIDIIAALLHKTYTKPKNTIIDIKTNDSESHKYDLQIYAYYLTFKDNYPEIPIDDYRILHVPKDTEHYEYIFNSLKDDERDLKNQWLSCIAEFYIKYGDDLDALKEIKPHVLSELKKEGII